MKLVGPADAHVEVTYPANIFVDPSQHRAETVFVIQSPVGQPEIEEQASIDFVKRAVEAVFGLSSSTTTARTIRAWSDGQTLLLSPAGGCSMRRALEHQVLAWRVLEGLEPARRYRVKIERIGGAWSRTVEVPCRQRFCRLRLADHWSAGLPDGLFRWSVEALGGRAELVSDGTFGLATSAEEKTIGERHETPEGLAAALRRGRRGFCLPTLPPRGVDGRSWRLLLKWQTQLSEGARHSR